MTSNSTKMFINKNKTKLSSSIDKYKNKFFGLNESLKKNFNAFQLHRQKNHEDSSSSENDKKTKKEKKSNSAPASSSNSEIASISSSISLPIINVDHNSPVPMDIDKPLDDKMDIAASSATIVDVSIEEVNKNKKEMDEKQENKKSNEELDEKNKNEKDSKEKGKEKEDKETSSKEDEKNDKDKNSNKEEEDKKSKDKDDKDSKSRKSSKDKGKGKLKKSNSASSFERDIPNIRKGNINDIDIDFKSLIRKGDTSPSETSTSTLYGTSNFNRKKKDTMEVEVENSQEKNKKMMETISFINNFINDYIEMISKKAKNSNKVMAAKEQLELINLENFHNTTNHLVTLLNEDRYPLIALIGRRGSGKSSFVNAILGKKVAQLGNIRSQTGEANLLEYRGNNNSGMDILDTRGINEGQKPQEEDKYETPVESIVGALIKYPVDCILYLHKAKELDSGIDSDIEQLNEIIVKANLKNLKIPIIGVITHSDELEPSDLKKPSDYDEEKYEHILNAQELLKKQLLKYAPDIKDCLVGVEVVSSAVIWEKEPDENGDILPKRDYRYNIDKIIDLLLNNLQLKAMFKVAQICNIQEIKVKFANELIELISNFVTIISSVPNRYSEDLPLNDLRVWMIYTIARLNNSTVTYETVYEFLNMFGFIRLSGYAIYNMVGAISKVIPGLGNKMSLRSKKAMTLALGKAAIAYFLENKSQEIAIEIFNSTRSELEKTITEESLQAHQEVINSLNNIE